MSRPARPSVVVIVPARDLAAFDQLPPAVRQRVSGLPENVAAEPLLNFWSRRDAPAPARQAAILAAIDKRFPSEIRA